MKLKDLLKKQVVDPLIKMASVLLEEVIDIVLETIELIAYIFK